MTIEFKIFICVKIMNTKNIYNMQRKNILTD